MKWKLLRQGGTKKSLHAKVLMSILLALSAIVLFMELSNIYVLNLYRRRAEETYRNSLKLYSDYWGAKLGVINNALVASIISESGGYFNNVCFSTDPLTLETSRVMLIRKLDEITQMHNREIYTFCYVPDRSIYIKSTTNLVAYSERAALEEDIRRYVEQSSTANGSQWALVGLSGGQYFIKAYKLNNGYAGAVVSPGTVLEDFMEDENVVGAAAFLDSEGQIVWQMSGGTDFDSSANRFTQPFPLTDYQIAIVVSDQNLYGDTQLFILTLVGIIVLGGIFLYFNMQVQMRTVLTPLDRLKNAMERFSAGDLEVRLTQTPTSDEIKTLYQTFNLMAEQIVNLKIANYESRLENQQIQSSYLRVQIQPHFYTNILSLIHGLAEIGDMPSIRRISMVTARYFRYLLNNKDAFVPLDREIDCVNQYMEIQQIRYPGFLEFTLDVQADAQGQLVPPLILQTFVENSVSHNVTLLPVLRVSVSVYESRDRLILVISDNGLGISPELQSKLNAGEDISVNGRHIGILNVRQRLGLLYGGDTRVIIRSREGETVIHVELPQMRVKDGDA